MNNCSTPACYKKAASALCMASLREESNSFISVTISCKESNILKKWTWPLLVVSNESWETAVILPAHLYGNEQSLQDQPHLPSPHFLHSDSISSGHTDREDFLTGNWLKTTFCDFTLPLNSAHVHFYQMCPAGINWAKVTPQMGGWQRWWGHRGLWVGAGQQLSKHERASWGSDFQGVFAASVKQEAAYDSCSCTKWARSVNEGHKFAVYEICM